MAWESVPPALQLRLTRKCVGNLNTLVATLYPDMIFFSSFTTCLRVAATIPTTTPQGPSPQPMQEGRLQPHLGACKPPRRCCLFPLAPTPTAAIACTHRHASKVMFFFFFFCFFSNHWRDLFSHMLGPQTPTSPPCNSPQALQVPPPPLPHSQARK